MFNKYSLPPFAQKYLTQKSGFKKKFFNISLLILLYVLKFLYVVLFSKLPNFRHSVRAANGNVYLQFFSIFQFFLFIIVFVKLFQLSDKFCTVFIMKKLHAILI